MALVGIYSFPKSGNTWVRSIISGFFSTSTLRSIPNPNNAPMEAAEEINGFRFYKSHSGKMTHPKGETTTHVIHIRRNPLDVFCSYLNYLSSNVTDGSSIPYSSAEGIVGTEKFDAFFKAFLVNGHLNPSFGFCAHTKSYWDHNKEWLNASREDPNIQCIRYEDLFSKSNMTLSFLEDWLEIDSDALVDAIENAEEMTKKDGQFFWRKQVHTYRDFLTKDQIQLFLELRGKISHDFGYSEKFFSESDHPVY